MSNNLSTLNPDLLKILVSSFKQNTNMQKHGDTAVFTPVFNWFPSLKNFKSDPKKVADLRKKCVISIFLKDLGWTQIQEK